MLEDQFLYEDIYKKFQTVCNCIPQDRNNWRLYDEGTLVCYQCGQKMEISELYVAKKER